MIKRKENLSHSEGKVTPKLLSFLIGQDAPANVLLLQFLLFYFFQIDDEEDADDDDEQEVEDDDDDF